MNLKIKETLGKILSVLGLYSERTVSVNGELVIRRIWNAVHIVYRGTAKTYNQNAYNFIATLSGPERPSGVVNFIGYNNNASDTAGAPLVGYINAAGQIYVWIYPSNGTSVAPYFDILFLKRGGG